MAGPLEQDVQQFCTAVVSRLGFRVDDHHADLVDELLRRRLRKTNSASVASYLDRFQDPVFAEEELREAAAALSVAETYFFRHREHFQALREQALPERMRARANTRQLRILSAGCASGEEPYSLAAAAGEIARASEGWVVRIWGIDANHHLLEEAAGARYRQWSLRGMTDEEQRRHFRVEGRDHVLSADLRSMVTFQQCNLLEDNPAFWQPGFFDVIFCRNVMIYLTSAAIHELTQRLACALAPGGFLFLSPSETLRGITQEFHLRHTHGAFYYQRRFPHERVERSAGLRGPVELPSEPTAPIPPLPRQERESWMAAISLAAGRIAALADRSDRLCVGQAASLPRTVQGQASCLPYGVPDPLDAARELLRLERFEDALQELRGATAEWDSDPDTLLLRAVLLVNKTEVTAAQEICRQLLTMDELNAGAHYLMAVCQEHLGDTLSAAEHDQTAIYLDAEFAMPHLHLGLLAKRLGDAATARRELGEALERLAREDASRILLFGGGFHREALVQFCQSQLRSCGGAP